MRSPRAVIFDLDGLLVDSEHVWNKVETEMIESRGKSYPQEVRDQVLGMRVDACLVLLKDIYQFPESVPELYDELMARYLKRVPLEVVPRPGAQEIVAFVHSHNIPTAIASSSPTVVIDAEVNVQGWEHYFDIRCTAEDDKNGKPYPDVYLRAAKLIGVPPAACIALEDSPNGARAAVAAGMTCYVVPDPAHSSLEDFANITPHIFPDLHAVLADLKTRLS